MQASAPSLGRITLIYLGFYLGLAVLINLVLWAAETFAGFSIEAGAVGWLPLVLGAMMAGQNYGARAGGKPPQAFSWLAGLVFMVLSVLLSLAVLYAIAMVTGVDVPLLIAQAQGEIGDDGVLIASIIGGFLLFIWVIQRFAFSTGAVQGAKQAAKRTK